MAILKQLETKFGINATYHRITAFSISYKHKKVVICVASYISKLTRADLKDPVEEIDVEIPYSDYSIFKEGNPLEAGYIWLKENVIGFEDSKDDFDVLEPSQEEQIIDDYEE